MRWGVVLLGLAVSGCSSAGSWMARGELLDPPGSPRPILVVDLDDTVVSAPGGSLNAALPIWPSPPAFRGASETLRRLGEHYQVVFLTARPKLVAAGTLQWLDAHCFPRAPAIFACTLLGSAARQERYKTAALAALAKRGGRIVWGVGDKQSDLAAYRSVGAQPILILECAADPDRCDPVGGRTRASSARVITGQDAAWQGIERILRGRP